jgi:tetratricopeptide (TPR) repeat protein
MQQASVVGRLFWDDAVAYINQVNNGDGQVDIEAALSDLRRYEMVFQRETSTFAQVREYFFKHALLREVTYESVLKRLRRRYHGLTADWLVEQVGERLGEYVGLIADHLERAGRVSEALDYLRQAGEAAARIYANAEAIEHYQHAIALGRQEELGIGELGDLFMNLGRVLELNTSFEEAIGIYEEMEALARQQGDKRAELASLVAQVAIQSVPSSMMNFERAQLQGKRALSLLSELEDHELEARLLWSLSLSYFWSPTLEEAISCGERSLEISRQYGLEKQLAQTLNDLGSIVYTYSGHLQKAIEILDEASLLWRKQGNLPMLTDSLASVCVAHGYAGNYKKAISCAEEALEISQSISNLWGLSYSQWKVGSLYQEQGRYSQAIRTMEESTRIGEQAGFLPSQTHPRIDLGMLYGELGATEYGIQTLHLALKKGEDSLFLTDKAYLLGGLGELYLQMNDLENAEKYIIEGLNFPANHVWKIFHVFARIASSKLALKKGEHQRSLEIIEDELARIIDYGMRSQLPYVLLLRGKILLAMGEVMEARSSMQKARAEAEALGSLRAQWQISYALSQIEESPKKATELLREARQIMVFILNHIDDEHVHLKESFCARPDVREILAIE